MFQLQKHQLHFFSNETFKHPYSTTHLSAAAGECRSLAH